METKNTPTEKTKVLLTDEEKKSLEDYRGENPFIKSISAMYLKYGTLSEKQLSAFRKTLKNPDKKENLEECTTTKLKLKEMCVFKENKDSYESVRVKVIREKALCIESEDTTRTAWIPNKAISIDYEYEETESADVDEIAILSLKDWFTKKEDYWKTQQNLENESKTHKEEPIVEHDGMKYNPEKPKDKIEFTEEEVRYNKEADRQLPNKSTSSNDIDDELPF